MCRCGRHRFCNFAKKCNIAKIIAILPNKLVLFSAVFIDAAMSLFPFYPASPAHSPLFIEGGMLIATSTGMRIARTGYSQFGDICHVMVACGEEGKPGRHRQW